MNKNIENEIKQAYDKITPDVFDAILLGSQEQKGNVIIMTQNNNKRFLAPILGLAAACLIFLVGAYSFNNLIGVSVVSLDVNPSIELSVNRNDKVISASALNADGVAVLGDMDIVGSDADLAINALVGSMVRLGYVNDLQNSILLSVEGSNEQQSIELKDHLVNEINTLLNQSEIVGSVLSQTLNGANSDLAQRYDITNGKAQVIDELLAQNPSYDPSELAQLSITELGLLLDITENIDTLGTVSDKNYIGEQSALDTALANAGVSEYTDLDVELELENGVMVYEVEFDSQNMEYNYLIDAVTGTVLHSASIGEDVDDLDEVEDIDDLDDVLDDVIDDLDDINDNDEIDDFDDVVDDIIDDFDDIIDDDHDDHDDDDDLDDDDDYDDIDDDDDDDDDDRDDD